MQIVNLHLLLLCVCNWVVAIKVHFIFNSKCCWALCGVDDLSMQDIDRYMSDRYFPISWDIGMFSRVTQVMIIKCYRFLKIEGRIYPLLVSDGSQF